MSNVVKITRKKKSRTAKMLKKMSKLPKFSIVEKKEPSWFDEALERIEAGKTPFKNS